MVQKFAAISRLLNVAEGRTCFRLRLPGSGAIVGDWEGADRGSRPADAIMCRIRIAAEQADVSVVEKVRDLSPQEYLESELRAEIKREYVAGQVYAMVGVSRAHNTIAGNLFAALRNHLRGGPCQVFISDMKVRTADAFFYPDVVVTCDPADRHEYYLERPKLVVEVLSPSTEARDTLDKRIAYQGVSGLEDYVLVAQHKAEVRIYRRLDGGWELETCTSADTVRLNSVSLEISVATIYEGV